MKDRITIDGEVYIKEKLIEKKEIKLFDEIEYAGYTWNVINIDDEGITLLMKDVLDHTETENIFFSDEYDGDHDVKFSKRENGLWWKDSIIRERLNDNFINRLDSNDLVKMETEVCLYGESHTTKDYVRLLKIEEIFRLPKEILTKDRWYWSLSPSNFYGSYAYVFRVHSNGNLNYGNVSNAGAVAPVIKLKTDCCTTTRNS